MLFPEILHIPLLASVDAATATAWALAVFALVGGAAVFRLTRRRARTAGTPVLEPDSQVTPSPSPEENMSERIEIVRERVMLRRLCDTLFGWLDGCDELNDVWAALDQVIRESLCAHLGATHVRCYRVLPGCESLQPMTVSDSGSVAKGPAMNSGVLGHAAATGREVVGTNLCSPETTTDEHAGEDRWAWACPVGRSGQTIGVIAVGGFRQPSVMNADIRRIVSRLATICWEYVACREALRIARSTDQASGVLTRNDFLSLAGEALAASHAANESLVVAAVSLEGTRRLDDAGRWRERDRLVEQLARILMHYKRPDDIVGRFTDDRFVILMRRCDEALGRIVAEKLLEGATRRVADTSTPDIPISVRVGLTASVSADASLESLLEKAIEALDSARRNDQSICRHPSADATEGGAS